MSEGAAPPNRWRRLLLTLLIASIAIYIVLIGAMYAAQGQLIYPAPRTAGGDVPGFETVSYPTSDGLELRAGFRPAGPGMPTILYFHGNGAHWQSSVNASDRLVAEGYGLFAAEYRGYGGNPGKPDEQGLYRDGRAALAWLQARGVEPGELGIAGNSLGSGVATQMAAENTPHALVLVSPFASAGPAAPRRCRYADPAAPFPHIGEGQSRRETGHRGAGRAPAGMERRSQACHACRPGSALAALA